MNEDMEKMLQEAPAPTLTLEPFAEEKEEPAVVEKEEVVQPVDEKEKIKAILTPQEQKQVDAFVKQIDITNSQMVLQYGASSQKKIADFSESALGNVRTKDLGEIGNELTAVVNELKSIEDGDEEKGFLGLFKKGGNKRGFIEAEDRLDKGAIESIKRAWNNLYSNNTDNVVVLNKGAKFKESSNTSVEMQLNENKESNAKDICGMFGFSSRILYGEATEEDRKEYINAVMSLLNVIETALDKDLLTEKEKESFYFAFDTKELTRGSLKERYEAYALGLRNNFLQIDEVRAKEDMEPLGFKWVRIGLNDVLLDVEKGIVYTPNMNAVADLNNPKGGEGNEG